MLLRHEVALYNCFTETYTSDKTYCSSNSILPGQLACGLPCKIVFSQGEPLRVEAPGISVPIARISYPMGVAGNREADCHRGLRPIKGMDA